MYNYKKIRLDQTTTKTEHRLIVEQHIGRELRQNEVVHHINGNTKDNRIENLRIMTRSSHARYHALIQWQLKKSPKKRCFVAN